MARFKHLLIISLILLLSGMGSVPVPNIMHPLNTDNLSAHAEKKLSEAEKQRLKQLEAKNKQRAKEAADLARKKQEKLNQAKKHEKTYLQNQYQLNKTQRSLNYNQRNLHNTRSNLIYIDKKLDETVGDVTRMNDAVNKRLRSLYMDGRLSLLQMILEASDISTLLDRLYFQQKIVTSDKKLLADLKVKVEELNVLKGKLAKQKELLAVSINTIESQKKQYAYLARTNKELQKKYLQDAAAFERAEKQKLRESKEFENQILSIIGNEPKEATKGSTGSFSWPIGCRKITSNYGYRNHPLKRRRILHTGLDIGCPNRSPVKAADGGTVIYAGWKGGYGNTVMINHGYRGGKNLVTLYGHMSALKVRKGQSVGKGQTVGLEGSTGYSTGPHLHFEVRVNGKPVNPRSYL